MSGPQVLHLIGGGDTGGAKAHLLPLLSALHRAECHVHLLCLGSGGLAEEAADRGLSVAVLPMATAWDVSVLAPLRRVLAAGPTGLARIRSVNTERAETSVDMSDGVSAGWDVVHTHGMRANLPVRLVIHALRRRPCLITTVHSDMRWDYASPLTGRAYARLDRITLSSVDTVICVSDALRTLLMQRGYPVARLVTVHSGIESPESVAAPVTPPQTQLKGSGHRPRVGVMARLVPVKDIGLLLEVTALLRRTIPHLEAVVVGDGPEQDRLIAEARARGLDEVVRFTGRVADVGPILAQMDVYLVTSTFEGGVSMSVLEAMAAGIPVVTTEAGGVTEAVKDGETGFVVSREQERGALAAALAERAAALLTDGELRARLGAAGARRVREHFLVERAAEATLRAYRRCMAARGAMR